MGLSKNVQKEINLLIETVVQKYINKATDKPKANSGNPFVMALLKDFEPLIHRIHGLKTSLGSEMEKILGWFFKTNRYKIKIFEMLAHRITKG